MKDFECDAYPAEVGVRIVALHRVDDGTLRQKLSWLMMIGHDDVEPEFTRQSHFVRVVDAAVDREEEGVSLSGDLAHPDLRKAVTLDKAAGQVVLGPHSEITEAAEEQSGGGNAVDVVVTVHHDAAARLHRLVQSLDSLTHVREEKWIRHYIGRVQEGPDLIGITEAPPGQDNGHRERHCEVLSYSFGNVP